MECERLIQGDFADQREPEWQPLLDLLADVEAPEAIDDFMWMFAVDLEDGRRLHAYKHFWTRRYIHLDGDGNSWAYTDEGYHQTTPRWHLEIARQDSRGKRY
jgi:hypothetical protein